MKVDIYPAESDLEGVVVIASGHAKEVSAFIQWLDDNDIDHRQYSDHFTGLEHGVHNGMTNYWAFIVDPDHQQRVLIKLRWK